MPLDKLPEGAGGSLQEASADLKRKIQAVAQRLSEEEKTEQEAYDAETAHGRNASKQQEWSAAIQARLRRAGIHS